MKTFTVHATIGLDQQLKISVPPDVAPGPAEVVVILNPLNPSAGKLNRNALAWTEAETVETRERLRSFEEDWEAPGMEAYDAL